MLGLIVSEVTLFLIAALVGFSVGWRLCATLAADRSRQEERTLDQLRQALTEAQVRRARAK